MAYTPTVYANGVAPAINATNLNHAENGLQAAAAVADAALAAPTPVTNGPVYWNGSAWVSAKLVDAQIAAGAGIAYSKLALANSIVSADIVDGSIVNADINASAAIGIAKLAGYPTDATKFLRGDGTWAATAGALVQICDSTLAAPASLFDTNTILGGNIPSTYNHLMWRLQAASSAAGAADNVYVRCNNDSAGNYDWERNYGNAATPTSAETNADTNGVLIGLIPGATATANSAGEIEAKVTNYNGLIFSKTVNAHFISAGGTTSGTILSGTAGGKWRTNNAAITRLQIRLGASNFIIGSRFTLYGLV